MSSASFSCILLAGGRSSRMGQDKALLRFGSVSLLEHMQTKLSDLGCQDILISRNQPGFISDIIPEQGPLSGLHACLAHCQFNKVLVVPVDMPALTATTLLPLLNVEASAAYYRDCALPCVLTNSSELQADINQQLAVDNGRRSVFALLQRLNATALPCHHEAQLINTNTPQQWSQLCQIQDQTQEWKHESQ
ncbi:molybdenum cofactor guanylyltransferase [Idiomarina sp. HP20-50]|uniref:molybdenum cofactor guanylyltransferase n=1 Tax=Idiomarina sp. HP20-50 TaxID=3070813 RepID=UPI00294AD572|nr:molybdenum cofactor guanylyltransferase [Idiomarina sp. HP20-50]MDV6316351.1 molybdenum cofactor guanylyltransferase [Idiomarina sp. HP20-50]